MDNFLGKIMHYILTACGVFIAIYFGGTLIDNFRVVINVILIMIAFLFVGCVVFESISYICRKVQLKRKRSH